MSYTITVKHASQSFNLSVEPSENIYNLRERIKSKIATVEDERKATPDTAESFDKIKLIFAGRELSGDDLQKSLEENDILENTVLHVVKRRIKSGSLSSPPESLQSFICEPYATSQRAKFYVYCKGVCNSVKQGKLRVRCSICYDGAFTVDVDPSSWLDVLIPGRIAGHCQTENCSNTTAEFYFKCSEKHEYGTPGSSVVALSRIKTNVRNVSCITCLDSAPEVVVFPCVSGHSICVECFKLYCDAKLNERRFVLDKNHGFYTIPCPADCDNSTIDEIHHFRILGNNQYDRYQRFGTEEFVLANGGVLCPAPGCGAGIIPDSDDRRIVCEQGCNFVFCKNCKESYHHGSCDPSAETAGASGSQGNNLDPSNTKKSEWEEASKLEIKKISKPCPRCHIPTERNGGCLHMTCLKCTCEWCWQCCVEWNRECQGDHWFD